MKNTITSSQSKVENKSKISIFVPVFNEKKIIKN